MSEIKLSEQAVEVLRFVKKGANTRDKLATKMDVSVNKVNGSITALKRHGLVELDEDGILSLTEDAAQYIGKRGRPAAASDDEPRTRAVRTDTKIAAARKIFDKHVNKGRAAVIERFQNDLDLTPAGASTYYQKFRVEAGMSAAHQQPVKRATSRRAAA